MCFSEVARLNHLKFQNEPAFLNDALEMIANNPSYCSPLVHDISNIMCPDVIAVCGISSDCFFSVLISSELNNHQGFLSQDIISDLYSTAWNQVYHKKPKIAEKTFTTEINPKTQNVQAMWDEVLIKHGTMKHIGSLRIHFLLPHIQGYEAPKLCRVEGNDVIIYIDKSNAELFFDEATCQMLAELTDTEPKSWKHQNV
jgi:hypothetical protein